MGGLELPWRYEFVWEETEEIRPHSEDKDQQQGEDRPRDCSQPKETRGTHVKLNLRTTGSRREGNEHCIYTLILFLGETR